MSEKWDHDGLLELLRWSTSSQSIPDGPHFVDDDEVLACLSANLLTQAQRDGMVGHLSVCPYCRQELTALVRTGVVEFAAADIGTAEALLDRPVHDADRRADKAAADRGAAQALSATRRRPKRLAWIAVAVAAAIAVSAFVWMGREDDPRDVLARARIHIANGEAQAAFVQLESLLGRQPEPDVRADAEKLFERAGYQLALADLRAGNFPRLLETARRLQAYEVQSGPLLNLQLQAERGVIDESSLTAAGSLLAYNYDLSGVSLSMSLPVIDAETERIGGELRAAVARYPQSAALRINYGQFLLQMNQLNEAREQFLAALAVDSGNNLARLGLGMAEFQLANTSRDADTKRQRYAAALEQFESVLATDGENADAHLNAAIVLPFLGEGDQVTKHLEAAAELTDNEELKERIKSFLREE